MPQHSRSVVLLIGDRPNVRAEALIEATGKPRLLFVWFSEVEVDWGENSFKSLRTGDGYEESGRYILPPWGPLGLRSLDEETSVYLAVLIGELGSVADLQVLYFEGEVKVDRAQGEILAWVKELTAVSHIAVPAGS